MSRRDLERLQDILDAIEAIHGHVARGDLEDRLIFDAVRVRRIEIGEAIKALPEELLNSEPGHPWTDIARMRDRLAHRYFDTTHSQVAGVVEHDLEPLKAAVLRLRSRISTGAWLRARHVSCGQGSRVPAPHPPSVATLPPDICDDEDAAPVVAQHRCRHAVPMKDGGDVAIDVNKRLFNHEFVDDVVVKYFQPTVARHDRLSRLYQLERITRVQDSLGQSPVTVDNGALEPGHSGLQVGGHIGIMPRLA